MNRTTYFALFGLVASAACSKDELDSKRSTPPSGSPARTLVTNKLMGDMPIDNHVFDPTFASIDGVGWLPYSMSQTRWPNAVRTVRRGTPLGAPALLADKDGGTNDIIVSGSLKCVEGPFRLSVYVGRPVDAVAPVTPTVTFLGYVVGQGDRALDLARDSSGITMSGGLKWERYVLDSSAGAIGWGYLSVDENSPIDLYLGAPILESLPPAIRPMALSGSLPRALRSTERATLERHRAAIRDKLGATGPMLSTRPRPGPTSVRLPVR